ncbi:unnamed protein product [Rangifer tarandus platyrhynchus]|uniref:Uncharacterized protein n=1 Tax=Rangifer tarandus platyrhynchus TaxID=3082113 RepID=A0AC60A619_RANTA
MAHSEGSFAPGYSLASLKDGASAIIPPIRRRAEPGPGALSEEDQLSPGQLVTRDYRLWLRLPPACWEPQQGLVMCTRAPGPHKELNANDRHPGGSRCP